MKFSTCTGMYCNQRTEFEQKMHTLKKFTKAGSSGTSAALGAVDDDGSKGPSMMAIVETASSSSNSLHL